MGFNTWNTFGPNINEQMMLEITDVMVERGYRDAGYKYVVIDDCWSMRERNENGELVADPENSPRHEVHRRLCPFQGLKLECIPAPVSVPVQASLSSFDHEYRDAHLCFVGRGFPEV